MKAMDNSETQDYNQIIHNSAIIDPKYFSTITTKNVARELLKQNYIFNHGEMYAFKSKSKGLGVYEIVLVKKF